MDKNIKEDRQQVYEIGYLLVSSIPEEKVAGEVDALKAILSKKGAEFIGEEAPELRTLAYTSNRVPAQQQRKGCGCSRSKG
jgi:ribosomal protein S6